MIRRFVDGFSWKLCSIAGFVWANRLAVRVEKTPSEAHVSSRDKFAPKVRAAHNIMVPENVVLGVKRAESPPDLAVRRHIIWGVVGAGL